MRNLGQRKHSLDMGCGFVGEGEGVETTLETTPQQKGPAPHQCSMSTACSPHTKALWSKVCHLGYGKQGAYPCSLESLQTHGDRHCCTDNSVAHVGVMFLKQDEVLLHHIIARALAWPCSTTSLTDWKSSSPLASIWQPSKPCAVGS
jgi:hypothetical protein